MTFPVAWTPSGIFVLVVAATVRLLCRVLSVAMICLCLIRTTTGVRLAVNWIEDVPMDPDLRKALRAMRGAVAMLEKGEPDWRILHVLNRALKEIEDGEMGLE